MLSTMPDSREIIDAALERARELGADVAGAVPAARLVGCPSAVADGQQESQIDHGTCIILGLSHDPEHPELDIWEEGRSTPGDRILERIGRILARWFLERYDISARVIPYRIEDGGVYLKDAACMAGIGRMGRNNLVIVPGYGAKIRFRAIWVDLDSPDRDLSIGEESCAGCEGACIHACSMDAFRTGKYGRERCMARMNADRASGRGRIDHCRACELACPARG